MNEADVKFFEGIKLFNEELFWDSIESFQDSISSGLEDKYADDCFLNIAICYMKLNLFNEAEDFFNKAIDATKTSGDRIDFEGPIYGKTSDRAKLGLIRIATAKNNVQSAEEILNGLKGTESYIEIDNEKISMYTLAQNEIDLYKRS